MCAKDTIGNERSNQIRTCGDLLPSVLEKLAEKQQTSNQADSIDEIRYAKAQELVDAFFKHPIFEHGMIRSSFLSAFAMLDGTDIVFFFSNHFSYTHTTRLNRFANVAKEMLSDNGFTPIYKHVPEASAIVEQSPYPLKISLAPSKPKSFELPPEPRPLSSELMLKLSESMAQNIAIQKAENEAQEEANLALWCEYPTDITRISPFFPVNRNSSAKEKYLDNLVITAGGWGSITYSGPLLSTDDETVLLSILAVLDKNSANRVEVKSEDGKIETYKYCGPLTPLFQYMGYNLKNISDKNRKAYMKSLKKLLAAVFTIDTKNKSIHLSNILTAVEYDKQKRTLTVVINPFFYESFCNGTTTLLDVIKRSEISGSISKSLYRFIQSHKQRENKALFKGHYLTVAKSINMNIDGDQKEIKKTIRSAIAELIKHNILTKDSSLDRAGIVTLNRTQNTFPKIEKQ